MFLILTFEEALAKTIDWYAKVPSDWWEVGTDSALAAHPVPKEVQPTQELDPLLIAWSPCRVESLQL